MGGESSRARRVELRTAAYIRLTARWLLGKKISASASICGEGGSLVVIARAGRRDFHGSCSNPEYVQFGARRRFRAARILRKPRPFDERPWTLARVSWMAIFR